VLIHGGRRFEDVVGFDLRWRGDPGSSVTESERYRLRAVVNLDEEDIRLYSVLGTPIDEQLVVPDQAGDYRKKLRRHEHAGEWRLADDPDADFLLIFERQPQDHELMAASAQPREVDPLTPDLAGRDIADVCIMDLFDNPSMSPSEVGEGEDPLDSDTRNRVDRWRANTSTIPPPDFVSPRSSEADLNLDGDLPSSVFDKAGHDCWRLREKAILSRGVV
jgi:hypothetical protein